MKDVLKIATRKSALAMWQANHVQSLLSGLYPDLEIELVPIVTEGDRIIDRPLANIGGKGLFLKELEYALLQGDAEDVPAVATEGLSLDVVLPRANPFDALVSNVASSVSELKPGSKVGTSSLRRQCQLLAQRPDLVVNDLRGNVDTRLRKLDEGQYDAIILACAGLERLGLGHRITEQLMPPEWLPASTQGIICLQFREGDKDTRSLVDPLNNETATIQSIAERTVARLLDGSCQLPLAVFADLQDELRIEAMVGTPDGLTIVRAHQSGSPENPEELAHMVANQLLEAGAGEIINALK
jgi:hydroxymethylbilane synthase